MVRTPGFHPEDPGSIPHAGDFFLNFNSDTYFQSSANSLSAAYYSFQHSVQYKLFAGTPPKIEQKFSPGV